MKNFKRVVISGLAAAAIGGCGGGDDEWGAISLGVTDAPVDSASRVVVEFTGVELKLAEGGVENFQFDAPRQIDLLALQGGGSELLLDGEAVPAGHYEWIRLSVNADQTGSTSFIEYDDGNVFPLFIPSGNQAGLRLVSGFDVPAGGTANFTIDFDLRRSVVRPPGLGPNHILRPALRLVDNSEIGSITGKIDESLIFPASGDECSPAVYVYTGADIEPAEVTEDAGPLTTALVELEEPTGEYRYRAGFIAAGAYTVAFTCEAGDDDAASEDGIGFVGGTANVTVVAGGEAVVDFPVD
ncbi:MAG: DUF4382 domain-containing protein [Gammaproteobacteria bacterium]